MKLDIEFDDQRYTVEIPPDLPAEGAEFFGKMDRDMDAGWQMSRWWVPDPDATQRCQIVADKLLNALNEQNEPFASLLCAYIVRQKPETRRIRINTDGEIQGNEFLTE